MLSCFLGYIRPTVFPNTLVFPIVTEPHVWRAPLITPLLPPLIQTHQSPLYLPAFQVDFFAIWGSESSLCSLHYVEHGHRRYSISVFVKLDFIEIHCCSTPSFQPLTPLFWDVLKGKWSQSQDTDAGLAHPHFLWTFGLLTSPFWIFLLQHKNCGSFCFMSHDIVRIK